MQYAYFITSNRNVVQRRFVKPHIQYRKPQPHTKQMIKLSTLYLPTNNSEFLLSYVVTYRWLNSNMPLFNLVPFSFFVDLKRHDTVGQS